MYGKGVMSIIDMFVGDVLSFANRPLIVIIPFVAGL